ncbi:MAG: [Fe-Fe] hydrogenase large subunit C-terminal domain-containing protein [Bacteroidales bacterium]
MNEYLEFKKARCKDCYKCLRECPVKAIDVKDHQAKIIKERCILCGHCTGICPQNAKIVHSERPEVEKLLQGKGKVIASVAPSFISSFDVHNFAVFKIALGKLGFMSAEETAVGANAVVKEYKKLLKTGKYKNFITSACPAVCRLIQLYYPKALPYLAPVDSPAIAHAKILRSLYPDARIVFIGPCIAKKREAHESNLIDGVLTFEDLQEMFKDRNIVLDEISDLHVDTKSNYANLSKFFPIRRGIIKSFDTYPEGYEYMAVDGVAHCGEVLENIETLSGVFLEMNSCIDGCVNGPCSLIGKGESIRATADVRNYVSKEIKSLPLEEDSKSYNINFSGLYPRLRNKSNPATESQIKEILRKTGKVNPEDELNCGACGYSSCREKAWAVLNGYADIEICLPYMRKRAESMSYEIIHNSPEGLLVLDGDMNIVDINEKAKNLLGIGEDVIKGHFASEYFNPTDFSIAFNEQKNIDRKQVYLENTKSYIDLSINILKGSNVMFGIMKDVTKMVNYNEKLNSVKLETLATTDDVIKKQMRVAQEIASLLGETTAETKVALLKLKKTLQQEDKGE